MNIKHIVAQSINTPMTRKEFFGRTGSVLLAAMGVMSVLRALEGQHGDGHVSSRGGYGGASYGGGTEA